LDVIGGDNWGKKFVEGNWGKKFVEGNWGREL